MIQADLGSLAASPKYFYLRKSEIMHTSRIPPDQEGRFAIVTNVGWDAMDAAQLTNAASADGKGVWSRSPDAGIKSLRDVSRGRRRQTKPGLRGERVISRKTIAQGRPACCGVPVSLVCVLRFLPGTRDCGCDVHPAFPAPSAFRRDKLDPQLGRNEPRERVRMSSRTSERQRAQIRDPYRVIHR